MDYTCICCPQLVNNIVLLFCPTHLTDCSHSYKGNMTLRPWLPACLPANPFSSNCLRICCPFPLAGCIKDRCHHVPTTSSSYFFLQISIMLQQGTFWLILPPAVSVTALKLIIMSIRGNRGLIRTISFLGSWQAWTLDRRWTMISIWGVTKLCSYANKRENKSCDVWK